MVQYAFFVNSSICTGCKTCQVACQDKNNLPASLLWRHVFDYGGGSWDDKGDGLHLPNGVFRYFLSAACNHCADPACIKACPSGAMQKDEGTGIVWTDHEVCIGCGSCATICPYAAPVMDEANGYMTKCDFCKDQVEEGGAPECVTACPQRALGWGDMEDLRASHTGAVDNVEPLAAPTTVPSVLILPHAKAQLSGKGTGRILNMEEEL